MAGQARKVLLLLSLAVARSAATTEAGCEASGSDEQSLLVHQPKSRSLAGVPLERKADPTCIQRRIYVASPWEEDWARSVEGLQTEERDFKAGCEKLRGQSAHVDQWMELWRTRDGAESNAAAAAWSPKIFSYHSVVNCEGEEVAKVPLEPLVSFLRHPRFVCFVPNNSLLVNKDYMLLPWNFEVLPKPQRAFLFDVGASLYKSGFGGASQEWFVNSFRARNVEFTRILAWEAIHHSQRSIYAEMPDDVLDKVSYYNLPASGNMTDKFSPIRALKDLVQPDDFVVLKIDIDTPEVEMPMIMSILDHPSLCGKIDELFFEHHTSKNPMATIAWKKQASTDMDMKDSYKLFRKLRECGIRAHSWV